MVTQMVGVVPCRGKVVEEVHRLVGVEVEEVHRQVGVEAEEDHHQETVAGEEAEVHHQDLVEEEGVGVEVLPLGLVVEVVVVVGVHLKGMELGAVQNHLQQRLLLS